MRRAIVVATVAAFALGCATTSARMPAAPAQACSITCADQSASVTCREGFAAKCTCGRSDGRLAICEPSAP